MKKKDVCKTVGDLSGKEFSYLGHFRQPQHIEAGHNTGISSQSKRAIQELDSDYEKPQPTAAQPDYSRAKGGPAPSKELLDRVEQQRQERANESLRKIMERRKGY